MKSRILAFCALLSLLAPARDAAAFDYLEHLWFTDRACADAQSMIAAELDTSSDLQSSYLALALVCPTRWDQPYCVDGYKQARANINEVAPSSSGYPVTLGDFAALADHVSRQGPIHNLPRARDHGLIDETLGWLTDKPRGAAGIIGDVAEDACETRGTSDWEGVERDLQETASTWRSRGRIESIPDDRLGALVRAPLTPGPRDSPMKYSFDNPHYLDLVLRNHHHFGEAAFESWNGFHSTAVQMRNRTCEELVVVDADRAEDLADHVAGWEDVDWDNVPEERLSGKVCEMLNEVVIRKVRRWATQAPSAWTAPVDDVLARFGEDDVTRQLADRVLVDLLSLVMEGTGIHYLQDGLAGGHMRTIRSREALVEVRHDHDADNRDGVIAIAKTREGAVTFVAWGDGYMLGAAPSPSCDPTDDSAESVSACLLRHQRGIVSVATRASLLDWARGGDVYRKSWSCDGPLAEFVCMALPIGPATTTGHPVVEQEVTRLNPGTLPVPPPDFSYESFSIALGYQPFDEVTSLSLRFASFKEIDLPAHWLTSWEARVDSRFGERHNQSITADLGFGFHYRLYARVMLDLVPAAFVGIRDFGNSLDFFAGAGPRIGFTALPEGWTKIPIEFTLFIDEQLIFFSTDRGFFGEPFRQRPRAVFGLGLAFMH